MLSWETEVTSAWRGVERTSPSWGPPRPSHAQAELQLLGQVGKAPSPQPSGTEAWPWPPRRALRLGAIVRHPHNDLKSGGLVQGGPTTSDGARPCERSPKHDTTVAVWQLLSPRLSQDVMLGAAGPLLLPQGGLAPSPMGHHPCPLLRRSHSTGTPLRTKIPPECTRIPSRCSKYVSHERRRPIAPAGSS